MKVLILMGSDSDMQVMEESAKVLEAFGAPYKLTIASAHRTPERTAKLVADAEKKGCQVIICGAGMAAHLAGSVAAQTILPVIGVPISSSTLNGMDALLSTVQMPPGVPVATVTIGKAGARNAAILALQILARSDKTLVQRLRTYKRRMADEVEKKAASLEREG